MRVLLRATCALALLGAAGPAGGASSGRPIGILLAAGDVARCDPAAARDEATAAVVRREVEQARKRRIPVRVVVLGDLAYESGTVEEFECFDDSWGSFRPLMLPVPGNHEYGNEPGGTAEGYFQYFSTAPLVAGKPLVEANGADAGYYAINFPHPRRGPWRLIGLNPYLPPEDRARQLDWLEKDLATSRAPCLIGFWHPYVFSSGRHAQNRKRQEPVINPLMLREFERLYQHRATLSLAAHDHNFEQFARVDPSGQRDPRGVRAFVVGTGGGHLRVVDGPRWPSSEVYDDKSYGVLRIELYKDRYTWSFLPVAGQSPPPGATGSDSCNRRR